MGMPVEDMELASLIEDEIEIIPLTNEYSDAVIEASMGIYSVRGALVGEVVISNKDLAHFIAANVKRALEEQGDAALVSYLCSPAVVRSLSEELIAMRVLGTLLGAEVRPWRVAGQAVVDWAAEGVRSDDLAIIEGGAVVAVVEAKASLSGLRYPLRASPKAVDQLKATLVGIPTVREGWLLLIDLIGHNALAHRADREAWLRQDPAHLRRDLRRAAREADWTGVPPAT